MKKQLLTSTFPFGILVIGSLIGVSPAEAFTITRACDASYINNVDANPTGSPFNMGCELGTVNNDFVMGGPSTTPNPNHQVNKDSMFGYNDWLFKGKDDEGLDFSSFPNNLKLGTYNLSGILSNGLDDVMIVLKGGKGQTPSNYVGYKLLKDNNGNWTGTWKTPFGAPLGKMADVSHLSLYYREGNGTTTPIPTPALLPGLISLFGMITRKKGTYTNLKSESSVVNTN